MTSGTSPTSFSTPHAGIQGTAVHTTTLPADLSPSSLDTLPVLTSVLARLHTASSSATIALNPSASPNPQSQPQVQSHSQSAALHPSSAQPQSQSQSSQTVQGHSRSSSSTIGPSQPQSHNTLATTPLTPKDVPSATDTLRHRLQRARVAVSGLPDMARTVREQEEEIAGLEERIRLQRGVLERLRVVGSGGERMVEG